MAYLDLDLAFGAGGVAAPARARRLEDLERQAVMVSRTDDERSLRTAGRIDRATALLFGSRPAARLADDRLEAVRRYAVLYRLHGDALDEQERAIAVAAGISETKLAGVRTMVDPWRRVGPRRRIAGRVVIAAAVVAIAFPIQSFLAAEIGDAAVSLILVLIAIVTTIAMLGRKGERR